MLSDIPTVAGLVGVIIMIIVLFRMIFRVVPARESIILQNRFSKRVHKAQDGPGVMIQVPILEKTLRISTEPKVAALEVNEIVTHDQLMVNASIFINYRLRIAAMHIQVLEQLVPNLENMGELVERETEYVFRNMVFGSPGAYQLLASAMQPKLEADLKKRLQERLGKLGIQVDSLQITIHPIAQIKQAWADGEARMQLMMRLMGSPGISDDELKRLLLAELVNKLLKGEIDLMAALNMTEVSRPGGAFAIPAGFMVVDTK